MIKNYICIKDCEYDSGMYGARVHKYQAGMAYMINVTYILSDKDAIHKIHRNSKNLIYGFASTKFIYKNFVLEDDYFRINSMFSLLLEMNLPISFNEAKIMRESLFKNPPKVSRRN